MVKLSEFVGEVMSELAQARACADATSIRLSQSYHADAFLKEMPVPHYTIDEAEISFPLSIVSVLSDTGAHLENSIPEAIKLKLPTVLFQTMKQCYIEKKKALMLKQQEEKQAKQNTAADMPEGTPADDIVVEMEKGMEKVYGQSANRISSRIEERMRKYLATVNFSVVKPLDIKDVFMDFLQKEYVTEFGGQEAAKQPVADNDALAAMIQSVGTNIFFEFINSGGETGIVVDACTGRLEEYGSKDRVMNIKLKVREQDPSLVVAGEESNGNAKRFLSLS